MVLSTCAVAQAQEISVPIDADARFERITPDLEREILLFPEYPDFRDARLFLRPDSTFVLIVEYGRNDSLLHVERLMTKEEVSAFRAEVTGRVRRRVPIASVGGEGRTAFLVTTTGLSTFLYGLLVPSVLEIQDGNEKVGTYLVTAGAGFFVPYLFTRRARVTDAMAVLALQGGVRGALDGLLAAHFLDIDDGTAVSGFVLGASVAELLAGYGIAQASHMEAGKAGIISVGGNFGLGVGLSVAVMVDPKALDKGNALGATGALIGTAAGYASATLMAKKSSYTSGDVDVVSTAGLLGAGWGLTFLTHLERGNERTVACFLSTGAVAGLTVGHFIQRERDFRGVHGTYLRVGTAVSWIAGAGFGTLLSLHNDYNESARIILTTASSLSTITYVWMVSSFANEAQKAWEEKNPAIGFSVSPDWRTASVLTCEGGRMVHLRYPCVTVRLHF
ncbi:MAG: hypothetical protein QHI48_06505 [Bacteroidota bacterium]|nr:hypothetical protein [Bacteroidota bacterium]